MILERGDVVICRRKDDVIIPEEGVVQSQFGESNFYYVMIGNEIVTLHIRGLTLKEDNSGGRILI